jgi:hypothetical protein
MSDSDGGMGLPGAAAGFEQMVEQAKQLPVQTLVDIITFKVDDLPDPAVTDAIKHLCHILTPSELMNSAYDRLEAEHGPTAAKRIWKGFPADGKHIRGRPRGHPDDSNEPVIVAIIAERHPDLDATAVARLAYPLVKRRAKWKPGISSHADLVRLAGLVKRSRRRAPL